jgi:carbon storage regulator
MLVLSRKVGEAIKLADDIEITILAVDNCRVRLGIRAPRHIDVRRTIPEISMGDANREAAVVADSAEKDALLTQAASAKNKEA